MPPMELTIEKLVYGGEGLAHHDGSTVFVPFVLPAERVAAAPVEQKKKFVRARMEKVLEASPERITPFCPHFAICGGCDYQHIPYQAQLEFKSGILRETLRRLGKIDWTGPVTLHASPPLGYRNRAQWKIRPLDRGKPALGIGYFRANSTALCPVEDCRILSPLLLNTLLALSEALASDLLLVELREIEAFVDAEDSQVLLTANFAGFPLRSADLAEKIRGRVPSLESLVFYDASHDRMELFGPGYLNYAVDGRTYRVGHFSFFQVNKFLVAELARAVGDREAPGETALDLFAGVGLFSLPLAERFKHVIAVEENPAAARDLEANARGNGSIEVRAAEVERFLKQIKQTPDFVVVDPPREGVPRPALERLLQLSPPRISYVSCEPPTLARDLVLLLKSGYEISEIHLFDLFPQTFHMEAVVHLHRRT